MVKYLFHFYVLLLDYITYCSKIGIITTSLSVYFFLCILGLYYIFLILSVIITILFYPFLYYCVYYPEKDKLTGFIKKHCNKEIFQIFQKLKKTNQEQYNKSIEKNKNEKNY